MGFDQVAIALLGAAAAWLSQERHSGWRRWAAIVGLVSQPFYLWATWQAAQWGMFALAVFYTGAWMRGIWVYWITPDTGCDVQ